MSDTPIADQWLYGCSLDQDGMRAGAREFGYHEAVARIETHKRVQAVAAKLRGAR